MIKLIRENSHGNDILTSYDDVKKVTINQLLQYMVQIY